MERFDKTSNYIQLKSKNNLIDLIIYFGILLMKKSFAVAFFQFYGSLSNRIGEELLGEALTVVTQLMLLFDLREKYNQCD